MARYFFDVHNGQGFIDKNGEDLPNRPAAETRAMQLAASYTTNPQMLGDKGGAIVVNVRDADTYPAFTVRLVFDIERG